MYKYSLEKYKNKSTRHTCPNCNKPQMFVRYINNESGEYLADDVGRCNREKKCGYHYKPRDYFAANPSTKKNQKTLQKRQPIASQVAPDFIPQVSLNKRLSKYEANALINFLCNHFPDELEAIEKAVRDYRIGTFEDGRTIFWQIDKHGKIRTGKLIAYNEETGKRRKETSITWIHTELSKIGEIKKDFNLEQCLFGEHLSAIETGKPIAIVEAEKTAIIASLFFPEMVWLATGGKNNIQIEKLKRLGRRTIILYPDADAFEDWQKKAAEAKDLGISIKVSTLIESTSSSTDKNNGTDLADYLIEQQRQKIKLNSKPKIFNAEQLLNKIFSDENLSSEFEIIFEERMAINVEIHNCTEEEAEKLTLEPESLKRIIESVLYE